MSVAAHFLPVHIKGVFVNVFKAGQRTQPFVAIAARDRLSNLVVHKLHVALLVRPKVVG